MELCWWKEKVILNFMYQKVSNTLDKQKVKWEYDNLFIIKRQAGFMQTIILQYRCSDYPNEF